MLNRILNPPKDCRHDAVRTIPGTGVYGIERTVCEICEQTFLRRTDGSEPGALFKNTSEGAVPVSPEARIDVSA